ncbi:hypothetical protein ABW19_dt0210309 [Dactylella cylindrospora]|nr:hypothetical protein ABW19_dt0210309 [Dactylella cylindrospora]
MGQGEIDEVMAVIKKVTQEIQSNVDKKAERLTQASPPAGPESPKQEEARALRITRARSGTSSSGGSEAGKGSKRKSREQPQEEPESRRRKTNKRPTTAGKATAPIRLAHKSRRSTRIIDSPSSSPPPESVPSSPAVASTLERLVLSGRTTRSSRSPHDSRAPIAMDQDLKPLSQKALVEKPPPPPKPSLNTLKEVIKEAHKAPVKPNAVPASKLSRLPGSRSVSKPNSASPVQKRTTRATPVGIMAGSSGILRASTRAQHKPPSPGVVPLDENHPGYDDLRDQAISKLTQLHALYQKISNNENQTEYQKFLELADENAEWRRQHHLKPIYIDVIYATGYYTEEITDSSLIQRVPDTEYLIDTADWDFDTAVELLQNVNRGTYIHELLQPVKEARRNAMSKGGKPGRGRPRKSLPQEIETSMSALKISSVPNGISIKDGEKPDMSWKCVGYDESGTVCSFEIDDASTLEGAKKASDHWRTCTLRQHATEEALEKKKANIEQAQTLLKDQQVRDPWTNIE